MMSLFTIANPTPAEEFSSRNWFYIEEDFLRKTRWLVLWRLVFISSFLLLTVFLHEKEIFCPLSVSFFPGLFPDRPAIFFFNPLSPFSFAGEGYQTNCPFSIGPGRTFCNGRSLCHRWDREFFFLPLFFSHSGLRPPFFSKGGIIIRPLCRGIVFPSPLASRFRENPFLLRVDRATPYHFP